MTDEDLLVSIAYDTDRHSDCPDGILACDCACHVLFGLEDDGRMDE